MFKPGFFTSYTSHTTLTWVAFAIFGLLFLAVLIEIARRRREHRRLLQTEWRTVAQILDEKGLAKEARNLFESFLRRHTPDTPLRTVTTRQQFDHYVALEIAGLEAKNDLKSLEKSARVLREVRVLLGLDYIPIGQRITSTRELYAGQVLWIAHKDNASPDWQRSKVIAVDEAFFRVAPEGPALSVKPGAPMRCRMWREDDARYSFETPLTRIESDPETWLFRHSEKLSRTQSRAHFRIHYDQAVNVAILNAPVNEDYSDLDARPALTRLQGRLTNLSAGGFAAILPQAIPKQVLMRLTLEFDPNSPGLTVAARLVNTTPLSPGRHLTRAVFVAMPDDVRDKIAHFVFQQQQPLRAAEAAGAAHSE